MALFDANCPTFFAPNEREEYLDFLNGKPDFYEVCEHDGEIAGAFGLYSEDVQASVLCWILLDPRSQGQGLGSLMMERVMFLAREASSEVIRIATSQKADAFFTRFGAVVQGATKDGWGPGLDRIDMALPL